MNSVPFDIKISVVIPAFNCEETINRTLSSLVQQNYDEPYEIIVVNDGSSDRTAEYVLTCMNTCEDARIRLFNQEHRGPAAARNAGIRNSQGELVLFIDSDCMANPDWIRSMTKHFIDKHVAGVGGTYKTWNKESLVARYVGYDIGYRHRSMGYYIDFIGSYSAAFRKSILVEVGQFDEFFTSADAEDNDLSYKIRKRGYKLVYEPEGWVWHKHPSVLLLFLKKQFRRATWRIPLYKRHPTKMRGDKYAGFRTLFQPILWMLIVLLLIASIFAPPLIEGSVLPLPTSNFLIYLAALLLIILLILNVPLIKWIHENERSFVFSLLCLGLALMRSLVWLLGASFGIIRFLLLNRS